MRGIGGDPDGEARHSERDGRRGQHNVHTEDEHVDLDELDQVRQVVLASATLDPKQKK